jgi:hypothetical protein
MNEIPQMSAQCECEFPGDFYTGVPGILAAMSDGVVEPDGIVERCDQCCRFESDAAAFARLVELGLVSSTAKRGTPFTVHCFATVRVTFPGLLANNPKEAASGSATKLGRMHLTDSREPGLPVSTGETARTLSAKGGKRWAVIRTGCRPEEASRSACGERMSGMHAW